MNRKMLAAAGLAGAAGVALSAAGAHMQGVERLATAGTMAMAQAPALLAIALYAPVIRLVTLCGWVIAIGLLAFSGALAFHDLTASAALASIAPVGGTAMIVGWLGLIGAALLHRTPKQT